MALTKVQSEMAGAGQVLQVVNATYGTPVSNATSTYTDTGLTVSITPKFSTSKILVFVNHNGCGKTTNNCKMEMRLVRGSTTISQMASFAWVTDTSATLFGGSMSTSYLDSPATTSATTYKTQFCSGGNNSTVYLQADSNSLQSVSTITLMEIAA